jgi:hypothetical protein
MIYRQSFNIVFMFAKQPWLWMLFVSVLGVANVTIAYLLGWNPRTVATATLLAAFFQLAPSTPKGVEKSEIKNAVDETYIELGISHGRAKAKLGLFMFFAVSVASYILAFSEVCSTSGQCTPLLYQLVGG